MEKKTLEMYKNDNEENENEEIYTGDPWKEWDMDEPDEGDDSGEIYKDD